MTTRDVRVPPWFSVFSAAFSSGEAHAFLLHGDLSGYAYEAVGQRAFLIHTVATRRKVVAIYHRASGITFSDDAMRVQALALLGIEQDAPPRDPVATALASLSGQSPPSDLFAQARRPVDALSLLERLLRAPGGQGAVAVIIDYADTLCPPADKALMSPDDRTLLVTLLAWAQDPVIGRTNNPLFLLTTQLRDLHPDLRASGSGYYVIELPLPDREARQVYLTWYLQRRQSQGKPIPLGECTVDELATSTAGLSLRHLEDLLLRAAKEGGITRTLVKSRKDTIIASAYSEVAEMIEPLPGGFADIGGMSYLKTWAHTDLIAPVRAGHTHDVPKGVLFVGPPGSGKTFFVRGLAGEIGFNAVALRAERILGGIVGQSEAKLARFFAFCRALAPVLVFVDEVDQSDMARRGTSSGNPVAANLFNQMLQFMSDETLRGRVVMVFATNRPDLLDPALLRFGRMDAILPVLLPDVDERRAIIVAQAQSQGTELDPVSLDRLTEKTLYYSSSDLAALVRKARAVALREGRTHVNVDAAQHALDTIRPATIQFANYYTLLAVQACNDSEHLSPDYAALLADRTRLQQAIRAARDEAAL